MAGNYRYLDFEDRKKIEAWHAGGGSPGLKSPRLAWRAYRDDLPRIATRLYRRSGRGATRSLQCRTGASGGSGKLQAQRAKKCKPITTKGLFIMIYTLEKRHEFGGGTMTTHWEVRSYTHVTKIGVYAGGKTLKSGTKPQCEKFCRIKGIKPEAR